MTTLVSRRRAQTSKHALPKDARIHNLVLLLKTLFHEGAMSRADLARSTGLTRVTTSDLIGELLGDGLIVEIGTRAPSGPGKPAVLVDLDRERLQVVALDLSGATEYAGALMDLTGRVITRRSSARGEEETSEQAQNTVLNLARDLIEEASSRLLGVGVGSPGVISDEGLVLEAPNIGWEGVPLRDLLQNALKVPVVVGNDANVAALAERTLGEGESDLLLVRVGRGVGSALLIRGELVIGRHNAAGEIGHVPVGGGGGPLCVCGKFGCLEAWISVPRLASLIDETGDRETVLREAGERLGFALAPIVGALNLSDIVVAAPHGLFGGTLLESALESLRNHTLSRYHDQVRMRVPADSDDLVLRGALVMVLSEELGIS